MSEEFTTLLNMYPQNAIGCMTFSCISNVPPKVFLFFSVVFNGSVVCLKTPAAWRGAEHLFFFFFFFQDAESRKNVQIWVKRSAHYCHFSPSRPVTVEEGRDKQPSHSACTTITNDNKKYICSSKRSASQSKFLQLAKNALVDTRPTCSTVKKSTSACYR